MWITNRRHSWLWNAFTRPGLDGAMATALVIQQRVHPPCGCGRIHSLRVCTRVSGSGAVGCISVAAVLSHLAQNNSLLLEQCWPCSPPEPWDHSTEYLRPGESKRWCLSEELDRYSFRVILMERERRQREGRAGGKATKWVVIFLLLEGLAFSWGKKCNLCGSQ